MNIKTFSYMCKLSQKNLKNFVFNELKKTHRGIIHKDGFVYAKGTYPILLVAHLDTVHKHLPKTIYHDKNKGTLSSTDGIGGDDRCGVYLILELVKKYNCSVVFCEDEEIGGVGSQKFAKWIVDYQKEDINNINFVVELDRKGNNDAVFYDCDNEDFEAFITKEYFKSQWGTFSDISYICPAIGVAGVNLSCGYYNAHTTSEYVVIDDVDNIYKQMCKLLDRSCDIAQFEYVETVYNYSNLNGFSKYANYDDDYIVEYMENGEPKCDYASGYTFEEAIGSFLMTHTNICYDDIIDIYSDVYSNAR